MVHVINCQLTSCNVTCDTDKTPNKEIETKKGIYYEAGMMKYHFIIMS